MLQVDPTYTGKRITSSVETTEEDKQPVISEKTVVVRTKYLFKDRHNIGRGIFSSDKTMLMANIDTVLNLTHHLGGYFVQASDEFHNFYSLILQDDNAQLAEYIRWRKPWSVVRIISKRGVIYPNDTFQPIYVDIMKFDPAEVMQTKPPGGYDIVGVVLYKVNFRVMLATLYTAYATLLKPGYNSASDSDPQKRAVGNGSGRGFIVIPFSTTRIIQDFIRVVVALFDKYRIFRPYYDYRLLCIGFWRPKEGKEEYIATLWNNFAKRGYKTPESLFAEEKELITDLPEPIEVDRVKVISSWQVPDTEYIGLSRAF